MLSPACQHIIGVRGSTSAENAQVSSTGAFQGKQRSRPYHDLNQTYATQQPAATTHLLNPSLVPEPPAVTQMNTSHYSDSSGVVPKCTPLGQRGHTLLPLLAPAPLPSCNGLVTILLQLVRLRSLFAGGCLGLGLLFADVHRHMALEHSHRQSTPIRGCSHVGHAPYHPSSVLAEVHSAILIGDVLVLMVVRSVGDPHALEVVWQTIRC